MKQVSGNSRMGSTKIEPRSHSISVDKVANLGLQIVRTHPPTKDLVNGRGFTAPAPVSCTSHKGGSQGKH